MSTRLTNVRGPRLEELAEGGFGRGAEVVFERTDGTYNYTIFASWYEGSYMQWGEGVPVLGDNVHAVTTWAEAMTEVHNLIDDDEDEDGEDQDDDQDDQDGADVEPMLDYDWRSCGESSPAVVYSVGSDEEVASFTPTSYTDADAINTADRAAEAEAARRNFEAGIPGFYVEVGTTGEKGAIASGPFLSYRGGENDGDNYRVAGRVWAQVHCIAPKG